MSGYLHRGGWYVVISSVYTIYVILVVGLLMASDNFILQTRLEHFGEYTGLKLMRLFHIYIHKYVVDWILAELKSLHIFSSELVLIHGEKAASSIFRLQG